MKPYIITEDAYREAKNYQDAIYKTSTMKKDNYTRLSAENRYLNGWIGEWGFKQFLDESEIKYQHNLRTDGKPDNGDFIIGGKIIDVKTASKSFHRKLLVSEIQYQKHRSDFFVGVRINGEFVEVFGFITYVEMSKKIKMDFGYGIPVLSIDLFELKPIEELTYALAA